MRVHSVSNEVMMKLSASSKLIAEWDSACCATRGTVRRKHFLKRRIGNLGRRSTLAPGASLKGV
jgi:hypothetical protein